MNEGPPEAWCWETLRNLRWPVRVVCPNCRCLARRHHRKGYVRYYRCARCGRMFSDRTGTPFEGSRLPLGRWFRAVRWLLFDGAGSTAALARTVGVNRKTAKAMQRRLAALDRDPLLRSIGTRVLCWAPDAHVQNGVACDTVSDATR